MADTTVPFNATFGLAAGSTTSAIIGTKLKIQIYI
jgi:hypothetical protein